MPDPFQLLVLLDVDAAVDPEQVAAQIPSRGRERAVVRLSDAGYRRADGSVPRDRLDWSALASALYALTHDVRRRLGVAAAAGGGTPPEVYVAGFAPLATFYALGTHLDPRTECVFSINRRRLEGDRWDVLPIVPHAGAPPFFTPYPQAGVSESTGRPAIFVSAQHAPHQVPRDALRTLVRSAGVDLASIVPLVASQGSTVDVTTIGALAHELATLFQHVAADYPHRGGITVALAGPASLALAAGVATNPNQHLGTGASVQVGEYVAGRYFTALTLPLTEGAQPSVPHDPESRLARQSAFRAFCVGIEQLKRHLSADDIRVPAGLEPRANEVQRLRADVYEDLTTLQVEDEPQGDSFELHLLHRRLSVGHGLLHALVNVDPVVLGRLGQLFTLHEVVHEQQGMSSNNYRGVGRSGVVLEEVDYWADAFALSTSVAHEVSQSGPRGARDVGITTVALIDAHIAAMRAFDRMEMGERAVAMPERRVRRYLIWYLQRARARTLRSPDDVKALFDARLAAELAPLQGRLDDRFDKIATGAASDCVFAFSVGGLVGRVAALPQNFDPGELLRAVVRGDEPAINRGMEYVVSEHRTVLAPWA